MSTGATNYAFKPYRRPEGSLGKSTQESFDGVDRNLELVQASVTSLIALLKRVEGAIPPDVSERVYALERGKIATYTTDPGDPAEGASMAFVLVDPGVSSTFVVRNNDGGTVKEFTQALS